VSRTGQTPDAAFYCVCDKRYFLGAVGAVNSLRLLGHSEPIYVLDTGLTPSQREILATEVTLVPAPRGKPTMLKAVAPLRDPAGVSVLIDADLIVTRSLAGLIDRARDGVVVGFLNDEQRFVPEWGPMLGLGDAKPGPYLAAGLVLLGRSPGAEILRLIEEHRGRVDFERSWERRNDLEYPFVYGDQDLLNAILATRVREDQIVALDPRLVATTPFGGVEPVDVRTLRCAYPDGVEPYAIHHILPSKPWLEPMYPGVYSRLLIRLLVGPGIAIRVPTRLLPVRLRRGALGRLARRRIKARDRLGWGVRNLLPSSVTDRLDRARARRAATR
jgi:hypothetical protein